MTNQRLNQWIKQQYNQGLLQTIFIGATIVFFLCLITGFLVQSENGDSITKAFTNSIQNWVISGDNLQLKQVTGQLIDNHIIDFVVVRDMQKEVIFKNDPFNTNWDFSRPLIFLSGKNVYHISCQNHQNIDESNFCFGKRIILDWFLILGGFFLVFFASIAVIISRQSRRLSDTLANQLISIRNYAKNPNKEIPQTIEIIEVKETIQELNLFAQKEKESYQKIQSLAMAEKVSTIATQLAHDIRSPLAVLEMTSSSMPELSEQKRNMIRSAVGRIKDLANTLTLKNKVFGSTILQITENEVVTNLVQATLISPLIEQIISEKRLEWSNKKNVHIEFQVDKVSYGLFALLNPNEFKRVISNILNNSIEAISDIDGRIFISLITLSDQIILSISDNGPGMPHDVLLRIGEKGNTYGKENGSGLGLFHAKKSIESWEGKLIIESQLKQGTTVNIQLKISPVPSWFVPKISLKPNQTLIIFDDDQSIHQIWKGRLESLPNHRSISLRHFSDPNELRKFYGKNFTDLDDALFLMDYEISGSPESGLDVIDALGIQNQSILVTSRYEEKEIRQRCEKLGVKLIPKNMSGFVPIEISYSSS